MYQWKKLGLIFSPQRHNGPSWMRQFAQAPCAVVLDRKVRVYFSCRPAPESDGSYVSYSAWVDLDRNDLTRVLAVADRPILSLGGRGEFDEFGTYPFSAVQFNGQLLGFYGGWTRCESVPFNVAIGSAISRDGGTTFSKNGRGPTISYSQNEPFILSGPKIRVVNGKLTLYYIAGRKWIVSGGRPEPVYKIRLAKSDDGMNWSKLDRDLIPSILEQDEAQASPDVTFSGGRYHMFFCFRRSENYRNSQNGYRIGYAWSDDADNWNRADENAGLSPSSTGWDSEMVCYPHILILDGKTYMFYIGNGVGREGFGLAVLDGSL
jgi:hypothetical protein